MKPLQFSLVYWTMPLVNTPPNPKIYHITHKDNLPSILAGGCLWSDQDRINRRVSGTSIGMSHIKIRRLASRLKSHPGLCVGGCVPFYFCPRSIMLYAIFKGHENYRGGQEPVIHLEADMNAAVLWAESQGLRWAFTTSNAGTSFYEDYSDLEDLNKISWPCVNANDWRDKDIRCAKQAEFLLESRFPWHLIEQIGVQSNGVHREVANNISGQAHKPVIQVQRSWYY